MSNNNIDTMQNYATYKYKLKKKVEWHLNIIL